MLKILLIDDETDFRNVLKREFTGLGYEVLTAADGIHGLQVVLDNAIDLILLDMNMPVRDGMETLRLIRAVNPKVGIIIITALLGDMAQAEAHSLDVIDILFKPVSITNLIELVQRTLGGGN